MSYKGVKVLNIFIHTPSYWELHPGGLAAAVGGRNLRKSDDFVLHAACAPSQRSVRPSCRQRMRLLCSGHRALHSNPIGVCRLEGVRE